jgi:recombination protein RecA
VQVFGPESSGKTTLAMHAIAEVQRQGGTAALIDAEHAFDPVYSKVSIFDTVQHQSVLMKSPTCMPSSCTILHARWCHEVDWSGHYMQRAGVDIDNMIMCQPDSGEMALEVVDQLVRSSAIDIIVVDSVAALVPRAEIEGEIGAVQGAPLRR